MFRGIAATLQCSTTYYDIGPGHILNPFKTLLHFDKRHASMFVYGKFIDSVVGTDNVGSRCFCYINNMAALQYLSIGFGTNIFCVKNGA